MLTKLLKHYPLSVLTLAAVLFLSLYPFGPLEIAGDVPLADKWTHMVMYAGLAGVIWWEWIRQAHHKESRCGGLTRDLLFWGLLVPVLLGGALELVQAYCTTYRSGEWLDFVADAIGAVLGSGAGWLWWKWKRRQGSGQSSRQRQ